MPCLLGLCGADKVLMLDTWRTQASPLKHWCVLDATVEINNGPHNHIGFKLQV